MEDASEVEAPILRKEVSKDGVRLLVIARRSDTGEWQLSVQNEYGVSTNWLKCYPSAMLAIEAGIRAIDDEGVEPFMDTEGFGYLFETV
jgi:hypothetical protein